MLAELYLKMDKPDQALYSVEEAAQIAATHQDVLYVVSSSACILLSVPLPVITVSSVYLIVYF